MTSLLARGGICSAIYVSQEEDISTPPGRGMTSLVPKDNKVSQAFHLSERLWSSDPNHTRFAPYSHRDETESSVILRAPYLALGDGHKRAMSISNEAKLQAWLEYHGRTIDTSLDMLLFNEQLSGLVPNSLVYDREREHISTRRF